MWNTLTGTAVQRFVIYMAIGYILDTAGIYWDDVRFHCIMVLMILLSYISKSDGQMMTTQYIMSMPRANLISLKDLIDTPDLTDEQVNAAIKKLTNKENNNVDE